jgi:hypothetical protein
MYLLPGPAMRLSRGVPSLLTSHTGKVRLAVS